MDELLEDALGRLLGDLLDLHAAVRADHQHGPLGRAIEHDAEIELALDLQPLLDEHALRRLCPSGPVWWVTSVMPIIFARSLLGLVGRLRRP